jgi:polar amino acid transport system permease protein
MGGFDWGVILDNFQAVFIDGALITLVTGFGAFTLAFCIGVVAAIARRSRVPILRWTATVYVEAFRNTPALVALFLIYFGLAGLGLRLSNLAAGVVSLGLTAGAYMTEIIRAGLQAVPRSQVEAAVALGLGSRQLYYHVWFPQAIRNVYLPLVNMWVNLLLGTSLLSTIGVPELTHNALVLYLDTFRPFEPFIAMTLIYLILTWLSGRSLSVLERRMFSDRG